MSQNGKSREDLVHEADAVRAKLLQTVRRLDRRRHEALDFKLQLRRHARTLAALGVLGLVITGSAAGLAVSRISSAAARRRRDRWRLARSVWRRPDRALRAARGPFFVEVLRGVAMSLVTMALTFPARRVVERVLAAASRVKDAAQPDAAQSDEEARRIGRLPGPGPV